MKHVQCCLPTNWLFWITDVTKNKNCGCAIRNASGPYYPGGSGVSSTHTNTHTHTQIFNPKKKLERSIINAFPCVVSLASNLVLRHLRVWNFWDSPQWGTIFSQILASNDKTLRAKFYRDINHLSRKNDAADLCF